MPHRHTRRQVVQAAGALSFTLLAGCGRWPGQAVPPVQQSPKVARIGWLAPSLVPNEANTEAFLRGLREHGWVEGQDFVVERRYGENPAAHREQAGELVALQVDVIVAGGPSIRSAMEATNSIPIVMVTALDPVGSGYVASLARPSGNVTGLSLLAPALSGKRLELLRDVAAGASRMAILWNSDGPGAALDLTATQAAAQTVGVDLQPLEVRSADDLTHAFEFIAREHTGALLVQPAPPFSLNNLGQLIVDLAAKNRLPTMYASRGLVDAGGLMAYGPSIYAHFWRAATHVDKILKGAKPADLPVEQPMRFDFVINLRTAQALGLTIPHHVLLQATEVIQ
jgi:putative tryptophan/tyrosine transport system substrate-binding protein